MASLFVLVSTLACVEEIMERSGVFICCFCCSYLIAWSQTPWEHTAGFSAGDYGRQIPSDGVLSFAAIRDPPGVPITAKRASGADLLQQHPQVLRTLTNDKHSASPVNNTW